MFPTLQRVQTHLSKAVHIGARNRQKLANGVKFSLSSRGTASSAIQEKRVLGAIAHINSGKTTTSEAMLYAAGALRRMGNVDVGDTALDYLPAERERGITINAAAICFSWRDHEIFLVDSPGHLDFTYEVERALKVMDGVIVLLDAVSGVQPQTETVWRQADSNGLARVVFVNKMDREGADFDKTVNMLTKYFRTAPVATQVPIFDERSRQFVGVYDLMQRLDGGDKARGLVVKGRNGEEVRGSYDDLSVEQCECVDKAVETMVERVAEVNDEVMTLWLDGESPSKDLMITALRQACIDGKLVPVICGSSLKGIGVEPLMDSVIKYLPSPLERSPVKAYTQNGTEIAVPASSTSPFLAYAFKVTYDRHRGRMVHLRAFSGSLDELRQAFVNTTKQKKEFPTKLLRVLADKYVEIDSIATGDIFAAVGMKHTATGDTLVLQQDAKSSRIVLSSIAAPPAVFSVALQVDTSSHEKELEVALQQLVESDSSLEVKTDVETGETLLSGMGELHLEVAVDSMSRRLRFPIHMSRPRVAYKETITDEVSRTQVYDTTIGSNRMRATLHVELKPLALSENLYANEVKLSNEFSAEEKEAIRDGIEAALGRGVLLGAPVTGVHVSVSSAIGTDDEAQNDFSALRACASKGVRNALNDSSPILLEPVMRVECTIPEVNTGDIVSELSHPTRRRGIIEAVDTALGESDLPEHKTSVVRSVVPLEGMIGWATRMRSITKGRGDFTTRFESYREVDAGTRERILQNMGAS